jgi:hypothetical protein
MSGPPIEPPRSVVKWLRANVGLGMAAISLVSAICGGMVSATWHVANAGYQLDDVEKTIAGQRRELDVLHADMVDVDRRLNEGTAHVADLRRERDGEVAALRSRVDVLEAQLRFFADRQSTPPIGAMHR